MSIAVPLYTPYKKAAKKAPATLSPIIGSRMPAAPGDASAELALALALPRVAVPEPEPEPEADTVLVPVVTDFVIVVDSVTAEVLVTRVGAALVRVLLLPARALLMMLAIWLAEPDGTGTAMTVVLGLGEGGRDVLMPTGMPDGPVGLKLAGVVTGAG